MRRLTNVAIVLPAIFIHLALAQQGPPLEARPRIRPFGPARNRPQFQRPVNNKPEQQPDQVRRPDPFQRNPQNERPPRQQPRPGSPGEILQTVNPRPSLTPGFDLVDFELPEDTSVGAAVYTLKGSDPKGGGVAFTISGDVFSINRDTGVITLREALDREEADTVEVIVTVQDEAFNIVPFRREIRVLDVNDNAPSFLEAPYHVSLAETQAVGNVIFSSITVTDADAGDNARLQIECDKTNTEGDGACDVFQVTAQELSPGSYVGLISLIQPLDYESRSSYNLVLKATDNSGSGLSSSANVFIEVQDVQDQDPYFVNAPYSATVEENTPAGSSIFHILARDGDTGLPRQLELYLVGDRLGFFALDVEGHDESGMLSATLRTSETNIIDREMPEIMSEGGLYAFQIIAEEVAEDGSQGDQAVTNVTILVTDQDDKVPTFNMDNFTVAVPEDVGADTPLPDLNIVVADADVSRHAAFDLIIENVKNAEGVFSVYPERAIGRTPVIIRVANPARLDYETEEGRNFIFKVNAVQDQRVLSSVTITVLVTDANDNVPAFERSEFEFVVSEDAEPGTLVGQIVAGDADSGRFGQVEYSLRGFGAEKFQVDPITGEITVNSCGEAILFCLDFETQESYALTFTGKDGGNQITTTSVLIHVDDVNDNFPIFEQLEYLRVVPERATDFQPSLVIEASDRDGPSQGSGEVFYSIHSINTDATVFEIDPVTGEVTFVRPAHGADTESSRYDLVVRATDNGSPPLFSDVKVTVKVGTITNQAPVFASQTYQATVNETAKSGEKVIQVEADDPDGRREDIRYVIHSGAKDNFVVDYKTGMISVADDVALDIQRSGDVYDIIVQAVDKGEPFSQTGQTTVSILVEDINDKWPKFEQPSYTVYVPESAPVGHPVGQVAAFDPDRTAQIKYSIVEPITARDRTGNTLQNRAVYDFSKAFAVDPDSGRLVIASPLSHTSAAVIIVTVQADDVDADSDQIDTAEVTFYIQAYKADSPQFSAPWTPSEPTLTFEVKEEQPVGTVLFKLNAHDPLTGQAVTQFEKLETSDPENLIDISPVTGEVINNRVLDFEQRKDIVFQVRARSGVPGQERVSDARIKLEIVDVNDNSPVFDQEEYNVEVPEDALPLTKLLKVAATDADQGEFGQVRYSINGEGEDTFSVDPETGDVMVKPRSDGRSNLDRERQDEYAIRVIAADMPAGPGQRAAHAVIRIKVLDVNDSPPWFSESRYSAVVPENSEPGTSVLTVAAKDPDLGDSGLVRFAFPEGSKGVTDLFTIDESSGEIVTESKLTGMGRKAPYILIVRALDRGESELFTDTEVLVTVGDVSSNDGVPQFIRPELDEIAFIAENANPGSKVFQVQAYDPDDPETSNGKIVYSLPDDGTIVGKLFQIDPVTGVLSTRVKLDREERDAYTLILNIHDLGSPPQQTSRLLEVRVQDVDDHPPVFNRQRNSVPIEIEVTEELELGTIIGRVAAVDSDEGENAKIDYAIVDGNDDRTFMIVPDEENRGVLTVAGRLDRERDLGGVHLLTIRCFRPYEKNVKSSSKKYDNSNLDEIQVKVVVRDLDDNSPKFLEKTVTAGVRVNAPMYLPVAKVKAVDPDAESGPVHYSMQNVTFTRPRTKSHEILDEPVFLLDPSSGVLQINHTLGRFADGYFDIVVKASNGINDTKMGDFATVQKIREDFARISIYVLQDTELMKFVFDRDPATVQAKIPELKSSLAELFPSPLQFRLYETEFYSKVDGSLDFGRTSSCFQVMRGETALGPEVSETLLDFTANPRLKELLDKYDVSGIERCASVSTTAGVGWIQVCLILIAVLMGVLTLVAALVLCSLYSNYKRALRLSAPVKIVEAPVRAYVPASLPPGSIVASPTMGPGSVTGGSTYWGGGAETQQDQTSYRSLQQM